MKGILKVLLLSMAVILMSSCTGQKKEDRDKSPQEILGNSDYLAFSYGGYRQGTRDVVPTVAEVKEDMRILSALGVGIIRTYNASQYAQAAHLLKAIRELKDEDPKFEMYVMLGAWIDCLGAWGDTIDHQVEDPVNNAAEIEATVAMVNEYPDIVKIIAVGNEAMVHWASNYFVPPGVILKWVEYLQELKKNGKIPADTWITSSDNFASWGGGDSSYHNDDLTSLMKAVDYISMHTYPFHDSHHNPAFWPTPADEEGFSDLEKIDAAMERAKDFVISQYQSVFDYMSSLGIGKPIHIGETGWATTDGLLFGANGTRAADEYKQKLYYEHMREWTGEMGMSCFYFEAFDERWKDQGDPMGSENHFGLINLQGEAKYALWDRVDEGVFDGLTRNGIPIGKTYNGDEARLMADVHVPPLSSEQDVLKTTWKNSHRSAGETVTEATYVVLHESLIPDGEKDITYPSSFLKLNAWEGTCGIKMTTDGVIEITTGTGDWWGCGLEMESGARGENLSTFKEGILHFEIKGNVTQEFNLGFQTGLFPRGDQVNNFITFGAEQPREITKNWSSYSIPVSDLDKGANFTDVTSIIYLTGVKDSGRKHIYLKNIYFTDQ